MTARLKRALYITNVLDTLVDQRLKHRLRLGVTVKQRNGELHDLTYRQLWRLFANFIAVIDPTPVPGFKGADQLERVRRIRNAQPTPEMRAILEDRLQTVVNRLLEGSIPAEYKDATSSYALDWTDADSWSRGHYKTQVVTDPDAAWGSRRAHHPGLDRDPFFGFDEQLLTMTHDDNATPVPELVRRIDLRASTEHDPAYSIPMIDRALRDKIRIEDVLADSAYTNAVGWSESIRQRKISMIADLSSNDRGPKGTWLGAQDIDGNLYCLAMPKELNELRPPAPNNDLETKSKYRVAVELRSKYKFVRHSSTDAQGYDRRMCPAVAGKVHCSIWDHLYDKEKPIPEIFSPPDPKEKCCSAQTISVPPIVSIKTRQKHDYGSAAFAKSYERRTAVERSYAGVKDEAGENVGQGRIRLMGRTKQLFMRTIAYVSYNVRIAANFRAALDDSGVPKRRKPRRKYAWPDPLMTPTQALSAADDPPLAS